MGAHIEILEGNHNHLSTLKGSLKDKSENIIVDWSSLSIYDDCPTNIKKKKKKST